MYVYWKNDPNLPICRQDVPLMPGEDHTDAVLLVKEDLVKSGEGYNSPVFALVGGTQCVL